jgi:segregation and condensation protein A
MEGPSDNPDGVVGDPGVPAHTSNATAVQSDVLSESQDQISQSTGDYKIKLEAFEGPLDLLLHLIRKEEMSIYDIQIARITDQYLEYLAAMQNLDIGVAGEFLVLAATLIHIKSQMLLPRDPDAPEGEVEDPRDDLVYQLLEHQKFKAAASALHQRATIEAATFTRGPLETDEDNPEVAATVFQLFEVFREVLNRRRAIAELEIARDRFTMAEKIHQIRTLVAGGRPVRARELFERAGSKHEMVMIFLGILEMVKELVITLVQHEVFGEIILAIREGASPAEQPAVEA